MAETYRGKRARGVVMEQNKEKPKQAGSNPNDFSEDGCVKPSAKTKKFGLCRCKE